MRGKAPGLFGLLAVGALALWLAACSSIPPAPGTERYMVSALRTPFYQYGPSQGTGADSVLENGAHVTLLYRSYGYSRVMLENGISGYVSTDDIAPLPPEPKPSPTPAPKSRRSSRQIKPAPGDSNEPLPGMDQPLGLPELPSNDNVAPPSFRY
jgi:hypothetical protein